MKRVVSLLTILAAFLPGVCLGGIFKLAVPTDHGVQFYWWPELPKIRGWTHDEEASRGNGVNMLLPDGKTFSNAPAVMYARALYKARVPETKSLAQLIADDRAEFEKEVPGIEVKEITPISDGDGKAHRCFAYSPPKKGSWELVAYCEEGDFYLIFTVSGNTKAALTNATGDFARLLSGYHERL